MESQTSKVQRGRRSPAGGASGAHTAGKTASAHGGRCGPEPHKPARPPSSATDKEDPLALTALISLSEEHKSQLREAFDMFDSAGTGRIKVSEVKVAFYALGYAVNSVELETVLGEAGVSTAAGPNGQEPTMDFNDFYNVLLRKMTQKETRTDSVRAFMQIDEDAKGYISLDDLREISDSLHMELTDDELVEMMLFAQSTVSGVSGGGGGGGAGSNNVAAEFGAKESLAVTEEQFLKLLKRANVF